MNKLYYDPANPASFGGRARLEKAAGKDVSAWLENQETYTLHKPARKRFPTRPTLGSHPFYQFQADLVDMQGNQDNGFRYILMVIDIFTRYGWSEALRSKSSEEVTQAFKKIIKRAGTSPHYLQTDDGKEFFNKTFQGYLKSMKIQHFSVKSQFKAALVERLNKTIKSKMFRYFTYTGKTKWVKVLPELMKAYNTALHRGIGMTPTQAMQSKNENQLRERQEGRLQVQKTAPKLKVGDFVRLSTVKGTFEKGYLPNWTREIFEIKAVDRRKPIMYTVQDLKGQEIQGRFYTEELQKVSKEINKEKKKK